jgi:hypothetical protein
VLLPFGVDIGLVIEVVALASLSTRENGLQEHVSCNPWLIDNIDGGGGRRRRRRRG